MIRLCNLAPGRIFLTTGFLLLQAVSSVAQVGKLLPSDEAARNPELFAFRAQLQSAIARHDADAVLSVVHPDIRNTFGGNDGIDAFRQKWRLPGGDSGLWDELGTVLALGGTFQDKDTFVTPYVFSRWPDSFDGFEHVAVLGTGVRVRSEPNLGGRVLTSLSFDVVRLSNSGRQRMSQEQAREWTAVQLRDGRVGYMASRYVRSPINYRAFLRKENGRWRLVTFIAGD